MLDLALNILCSSLIFVVFRLFKTYEVETFYAIVTNYVIACLLGWWFNPNTISFTGLVAKDWFPGTALLGVLFILVFFIMAKSSQINGVGVTSVATKMSLVIPVLFGVFYYSEILSPWQITGILLALVAVYLTAGKEKGIHLDKGHIWLPVLVFLGSGIIDTSLNFAKENYLHPEEFPLFSATVFGAAATSGVLFIIFKSIKNSFRLNFKNITGGILLGVPNYFSIYFLLRALNNDQWNSASIFTINNVTIVLFTTLLGILLFKEKLSGKNWWGVLVAVGSIILVALF